MNKKQLIASMPRTMTRREVAAATGVNFSYVSSVSRELGLEFKQDRNRKADPVKVKEMKSNPYAKTIAEWAEYLGLTCHTVAGIRRGRSWGDL